MLLQDNKKRTRSVVIVNNLVMNMNQHLPDNPHNPEIPDMPGEPGKRDLPPQPGQPDLPIEPNTPDTPAQPGRPVEEPNDPPKPDIGRP